MDCDEEYIVEAIRSWRYNLRESRREYLIKWLNYDEEENTWEPEQNLSCPDIFEQFRQSLTKRQLRFLTYRNPEVLSGFQRNAQFVEIIGIYDIQPEITLIVMFDDSDLPEDVSLTELAKHRPEATFEYFEQRVLAKKLN